jgi:hypothetical protein
MKTIQGHLDNLPKYLKSLESKINQHEPDGVLIKKAQQNIDKLEKIIDEQGFQVTNQEHTTMFEVQILIEYAKGNSKKAKYIVQSILSNDTNVKFFSKTANKLASGVVNTSNVPKYFTVSTTRLVTLTLITFGYYLIYWFYKNWKAVQEATGEKAHPVLSAIFAPLTSYELFGNVRKNMRSFQEGPKVNAGMYAWGVFLLSPVLLAFIPILTAQKHMNFVKQKVFGEEHIKTGTSIGEVLFVLLASLIAYGSIYSNSRDSSDGSGQYQLSPAAIQNKGIMDQLTKDYEVCSQDLARRESKVDLYSQTSIDNYNSDWNDCEQVRLKQNQAVDRYNKSIGL